MIEENILKGHDSFNLRQIKSIHSFNEHIEDMFNKNIELLGKEVIELRETLNSLKKNV
jgi:hypothetical protein